MASAKNQVLENKAVYSLDSRLGQRKKKRWQNEGITRGLAENKRDTELTWLKFTANP